ncbi:MAG: trypsin-like peptidase domain-containing protein [Polaromonas sp.]|nr:trypsin-like peptidase domain-containing protein [Polaromonas sp.]
MPRQALYSRPARPTPPDDRQSRAAAVPDPTPGRPDNPSARHSRWFRVSPYLSPHNIYLLWGFVGVLALLLAVSLALPLQPGARTLTQNDINAAVLKTLETTQLPSATAKAYDVIAPSVVRVVAFQRGQDASKKSGKDQGNDGLKDHGERSVGTGVVIVDKGVILTNLHVVQGADTIRVTFADGLESTASITSTQPENDLAVLQAHTIPDDMVAATMRSTADLRPGDQVMAVGYPFGIGPSASSGIVSGLKRVFRSPEGKQEMRNLIQFDAAANPGNSGGPLVTMDGEVIGIVTAIFNPNQQRTFVGIGFAVPIENAASAAGVPPF